MYGVDWVTDGLKRKRPRNSAASQLFACYFITSNDDVILVYRFEHASNIEPFVIEAARASAKTSEGMPGNLAAQKARVLTQSISPVSWAVMAWRSSLIKAAFSSSFLYKDSFIFMSNINKFDEYVGRVFGILYESFPIPTDLNIGDVLGLPDLYSSSGIPPEMDTEANIATYSVIWLANTGYIKMTGNSGNEFFDLTLTEKGLQVLKAIPGSLTQQSLPLGKQIAAAVKSGAKETLRSLVNEALAIGIKIVVKSAGFDA